MRVTSSHLAVWYQEVITWFSKVNMEWIMENQECLAVCVCLNFSLSESKARRLMQSHTEEPRESLWLCNTTGLQINTECVNSSAYVDHPSEFITNIAAYFIISHPAETREAILNNLELKRIFSQKCFNFPLNVCISFVPVVVFLWRTDIFQISWLLFRFLSDKVFWLLQNDRK